MFETAKLGRAVSVFVIVATVFGASPASPRVRSERSVRGRAS